MRQLVFGRWAPPRDRAFTPAPRRGLADPVPIPTPAVGEDAAKGQIDTLLDGRVELAA